MTRAELSAIDELRGELKLSRDELHAYHVDVKLLVARCEDCRADVVQLATDMYGLPGNKEASPGLIGTVQELCSSRRMLLLAVRGAWILIVAMAGALATAIARMKL